MMDRSTYMSGVASELYERKYERFQVKLDARLITIGTGLMGLSERAARVVDISVAGAGLEVGMLAGLPPHYYLKIAGFPNRIGCAEVHRFGTRIGVKFLAHIDEDLIHRIIRSDYLKGR